MQVQIYIKPQDESFIKDLSERAKSYEFKGVKSLSELIILALKNYDPKISSFDLNDKQSLDELIDKKLNEKINALVQFKDESNEAESNSINSSLFLDSVSPTPSKEKVKAFVSIREGNFDRLFVPNAIGFEIDNNKFYVSSNGKGFILKAFIADKPSMTTLSSCRPIERADNKQAFTFDVVNPKTRAVIKSECLFYNLIVHPDYIEIESAASQNNIN